jgi:hypothetical protein
MRPGDLRRTCVVAKNVRFEDGVIANSPGYEKVRLITPILEDCISHWKLDEASGVRADTHGDNDLALGTASSPFIMSGTVTQTTGKIGSAAVFPESVIPAPFGASPFLVNENPAGGLETLYSGAYTVSGWFKPSSITAISHTIAVWAGGVLFQEDDEFIFSLWDGGSFVNVTFGALVADTWAHFVITFNPGASQIQCYFNNGVATTAAATVSALFGGSDDFYLGNAGTDAEFYFDSVTVWSRVLTSDERTFLYNSGAGRDYPFLSGPFTLLFEGNLISDPATPFIAASGAKVHHLERSFDPTTAEFEATLTEIYSGLDVDEEFPWTAANFFDKVVLAQHDNPAQYWLSPLPNECRPLPGLPTDEDTWDGVTVFFDHVLLWRDDKIKWSDKNDFTNFIPVGTTVTSAVLTIANPFVQPAPGATEVVDVAENPVDLDITVGQFVRIDDDRGVDGVFYNFYEVTAISVSTVTLERMDLTGGTTTGLTIDDAQQILTLDANEAGENRIVGGASNGKIYQIIDMGDFAYIFKTRSIHSMQYVGVGSGVFFIHPEVRDEGLLTRKSLVNLGDGRIVFLGHRELYQYAGGPNLTPVCQQFTRQLFAEIDRTRLSEVALHHNESRNEVWVHYPIIGGSRVLIYNYAENTASIDEYDSDLGGLSALGAVGWPTDTPWSSLSEIQTWENFDQQITWADLVSASEDRITVMATWSGELLVWGTKFSRDGEGYVCTAETQDHDCDEPDIFKYVDVVLLALEVKAPDTESRLLYVQVGAKDSLDQTIRWSERVAVHVEGDTTPPIKINPGGSGRYLRLRFESEDADVQWRVSSYEIHCRPGGFY